MKSSITIAVAMLLCLLMASHAFAQCPDGPNCIPIMDGCDGDIYGDSSFVTVNSLYDVQNDGVKAQITDGVLAKVYIPEGVQGAAFAVVDQANQNSYIPIGGLNGEGYTLNTAFQGKILVGAQKSSNKGVESTEAKIFAKSAVDNSFASPDTCPTCKKDYLSGDALISANIASSGTGGSYAIITDAAAAYDTKRTCPTCPTIYKEVTGQVAVEKVSLQTCNSECPDGLCNPAEPTGSKWGSLVIDANSNANNYQSNAYAKVTADVTATRTKAGRSTINGDIDGYLGTPVATASARDGSAPSNSGWNAVATIDNKNANYAFDLDADAYAFAANDKANAKITLNTEANSDYNAGTNRAYSLAESYMAVKRADLNTPMFLAFAEADVDYAKLSAVSKDLKTTNKNAQVSGIINDLDSKGQLKYVSDIWNKATLTELATRNGNNAFASITNDVQNFGPKTGFATDYSQVTENFKTLTASAKSPSETRSVAIDTKTVNNKITGTTGTATGTVAITGLTTNAGGVTTINNDLVQTYKQGVNNVWKLTFSATND